MSAVPTPPPDPATRPPMPPASPSAPRPGQPPQRLAPVFDRRFSKPTMHPRRVTGGIKIQAKAAAARPAADDGPAPDESQPVGHGPSWASARWLRLLEDFAPGDQLAQGLEYAQMGQTRTLELSPGQALAHVQGRMPAAYTVSLRLPTFTQDQWDRVVSATASQARYTASLLSGELPPNVEDIFTPAGLSLFPADPSGLSCSCTCDIFTRPAAPPAPRGPKARPAPTTQPWCKHICCVMFLIADRLAANPLTIFSLRGLPEADLLERLRQQRALAGLLRSGGAAAPVYSPHLAGLPAANAPLEQSADHFWTPTDPTALDELDTPIVPPELSHPLLRRIGPSPFTGAKFPLAGLLATCYDTISQAVIRGEPADAQAVEPPLQP